MWFGTATGLIRFDGTSVFRYETDQVNGNAVVSNSINAIIEDDKNNLWIGTANGLAIYNPQRDNFIDVDLIPENMNHLTSKYISALAVDSSGRIWIATHGQGLNIYDPRTFTFTYLKYPTTPNKIPPGNYITSLCFSDNTMWVGTKGGLKLFDARHVTPATLPVKTKAWRRKSLHKSHTMERETCGWQQ
jgi:ligand-binding sensor domain-containing protein